MKKGAQMQMSFGMIFSIILIIVFIVVAFYAISKFLNLGKNISVEKFVSDLQSDIDKVWKGSQASVEKEYSVTDDVLRVCFEDNEDISEEMYLRYETKIDRRELQHVNIEATTAEDNPFCIESEDEKIKLSLEKDFGESLVTISKVSEQS